MSKRIIKYFVLCVTMIGLSSCAVSSRIRKADRIFEYGEYYEAAELYKKAQRAIKRKNKEQMAEVCFKLGECYRLSNGTAKATRAYSRAITNKYKDPIIYLRYAQSLHKNGQYAEALKNYKKYLEVNSECILAKNGAAACEQMEHLKKEKTRYVVSSASLFNSKRNSEYCPAFMGNSESLVITSNRDNKLNKKVNPITGLPNNNLFTTKKNAEGKWETLQMMEGEFNTADDEGACCFSADGKTMYFTRCRTVKGANLGAEIYVSNRSGAQWSAPAKVGLFQDSTVSVAHPALSPDERYLYFVSDHKNGVGGKDLWRSEWQEDGSWGMAENLGKDINTEGDEMFPYFDSKGRFYFASDGHGGFGGLDIYRIDEDSTGLVIKNMGIPLNSNADDFGITFEDEREAGFFSSNRGQNKGYDKIWSFVLPEELYAIEGFVKDQDGEVVSDAIIKLVGNCGSNVKMRTKKDGSYRIKLQKGEKYVMLASSRGYLNRTYDFTTEGLNDSKTFAYDFQLVSVSKPVQMDNIFYEFGKWELTSASEKSLGGLIKLLNDNPNITIEIMAHTDSKGTEAYNQELSEKRAKSVVDFLIRSGIDAERLSWKGFGKSQPVVVDKKLSKQYKWMKVNQVLDEKFYEVLTDEQKDIVDQINRRTEFRVVKTTYKLY